MGESEEGSWKSIIFVVTGGQQFVAVTPSGTVAVPHLDISGAWMGAPKANGLVAPRPAAAPYSPPMPRSTFLLSNFPEEVSRTSEVESEFGSPFAELHDTLLGANLQLRFLATGT